MSFNTGELPLRTLYAINVSSRAPDWTNPALQVRGPTAGSRERHAELERFRSELLTIAGDLPKVASNVPAEFLMPFVRKVFHEDLSRVDFALALTAMDYLQNLDVRRRREHDAVMTRLGVKPGDATSAWLDRQAKDAQVRAWVNGLEAKAKEAEACFTQCFVGLRQWVSLTSSPLTLTFQCITWVLSSCAYG